MKDLIFRNSTFLLIFFSLILVGCNCKSNKQITQDNTIHIKELSVPIDWKTYQFNNFQVSLPETMYLDGDANHRNLILHETNKSSFGFVELNSDSPDDFGLICIITYMSELAPKDEIKFNTSCNISPETENLLKEQLEISFRGYGGLLNCKKLRWIEFHNYYALELPYSYFMGEGMNINGVLYSLYNTDENVGIIIMSSDLSPSDFDKISLSILSSFKWKNLK